MAAHWATLGPDTALCTWEPGMAGTKPIVSLVEVCHVQTRKTDMMLVKVTGYSIIWMPLIFKVNIIMK